MSTNYNHRGFTLIELLVVISIVSLLSSIILASLSTARSKAQIAAGQQFAASVYHTAGDYIVGWWNFDECSGTLVKDTSGNGNNGSFTSTPLWSTDTPNGSGCSLSFNGTNQFVSIPSSSSLSNYQNGITVSFWFKANSFSQNLGLMGQNGPGYLNFYFYNNGQLRFETDGGNSITTTTHFSSNVWYQVVAVYDTSLSSNQAKVYINGVLNMQGTITFNPTKTQPITIGGYAINSYPFNGNIDDVRFYAKSLTADVIQDNYYAALSSNKNLALNH